MKTTDGTIMRATYDLTGVVQGVGFRPAVYRLATEAGLGGRIQNRMGVVRLTLEGTTDALARFIRELPRKLPSPARIESVTEVDAPIAIAAADRTAFRIAVSKSDDNVDVVIPADLGMCPDCHREVFDPADRRYGYAFTTCTACGPRYTVVNGMPYDRERTTLAAFPMCADCQREYDDPGDRRFHAESTACPVCGPRLWLLDAAGKPVDGDPLSLVREALAAGAVVAVRGIGGYLLTCDAANRSALETLRARKQRPHKPFAVMARDLEAARAVCCVAPEAAALLESPERPIVILDHRQDAATGAPIDLITPDAATLGMMLPTSPLHALLFDPVADDPTPTGHMLVMTSGNRRGEPICITNAEALERLNGIADLFLCHDREINLRNDDSLVALQCGQPQVWRRARGFAPQPVSLTTPIRRTVLATGPELKNTIALAYDNKVVLSPHIGDLETPEANDGFEQVIECLPRFLDRTPDVIATDLHPDMHSTRVGHALADSLGVPLVEVQHHHAHAAACLAEYGRREGLALVLDGTGLGTDGAIWGAELLALQGDGFGRLASFAPVPLPGADAAVRQPLRQLVGRWFAAGITPPADRLRALGIDPASADIWTRQCAGQINAPTTHAAGRLFDAFSAALGVPPETITYEGQAAIRLEAIAAGAAGGAPALPYELRAADGFALLDWSPTFALLEQARPHAADRPDWAMALHHAIAHACVDMVRYGFSQTPRRSVALSGGVFMNRILTGLLVPQLEQLGAEVLVHRDVPPNDGGVALGQAVIAGRS